MHRVELVDEPARPVTQHVTNQHAVCNAEGEVQVGEAVAIVKSERAHGGPRNNALVVLRELQQAVAESVALLNGEHEGRS